MSILESMVFKMSIVQGVTFVAKTRGSVFLAGRGLLVVYACGRVENFSVRDGQTRATLIDEVGE